MTRFSETKKVENTSKMDSTTESVVNRLHAEAATADNTRTRYTAADSQTVNNVADTIKALSECKPENMRRVLAECLQKQLNDPRHPYSPGQLRAFVNLLNKECRQLGEQNPLKGLTVKAKGMLAVIEDPQTKAKTTVSTHSIATEVNGKLVTADDKARVAVDKVAKAGQALKHEASPPNQPSEKNEKQSADGNDKSGNNHSESKEGGEKNIPVNTGDKPLIKEGNTVNANDTAPKEAKKQDGQEDAAEKLTKNEKTDVDAAREAEKAEQAKQLSLAQAFLDKYYRDITAAGVETKDKLPVAQAELNQAEKQFKACYEKYPPASGSKEEQDMNAKLQELKNQQDYMKSLVEAQKQPERKPPVDELTTNPEAAGDRFNDPRYKQMSFAEQRGDMAMMSSPQMAAAEYHQAADLYTAYLRGHWAQMNEQERDVHNRHYRNIMDKYRQASIMSRQEQFITPYGPPPMVPPPVPPLRMDVGPGVIEIPNPLELFQF